MSKVVVITGASSGIGESLRRLYLNKGWTVLNLSRTTNGEPTEFDYKCDISDAEQIKNVFAQIQKKYKTIDMLINNAGFAINGAMEMVTEEQFKTMMDVNVFGVYACSKYALPLMNKGAKIINVSSIQGIWAVPFRGVYSLSKAAVLSMTYTQRMELHKSGIQVMAICPGEIKTNFSKNRVRNYDTNQRYGDAIQKSLGGIEAIENKRMNCDKACKIIFKACNRKKLKPVKIIGKKYIVLLFVLRFFSINAQLNLIRKKYI